MKNKKRKYPIVKGLKEAKEHGIKTTKGKEKTLFATSLAEHQSGL
jgi:hypothetical protein